MPRQHGTGQHHDADVQTHDVAHAQQRRRQVGAQVGDALAVGEERTLRPAVGNHAQATGCSQLHQRANGRRKRQDLQARAGILTSLQYFGSGLAFRERQRFFHDHRAPQRHGEQHAQQATKASDTKHPPVFELGPEPHDDQCRDGEDDTGGDGGTRRGTGLHDVVFQDGAATQQAQHAHRHDRRRNRGGNGQAGKKAKIGIGRRQDHGQHDGQRHGAEGKLRHLRAVHANPGITRSRQPIRKLPASPVLGALQSRQKAKTARELLAGGSKRGKLHPACGQNEEGPPERAF